MAYAIMRFEKHKARNVASLAGSLSHTFRSRYTPNAVPEKAEDNRVWLGPSDPQEVADAIRDRFPTGRKTKPKSDSVGCLEFFIGASPEWFPEHGGDGDADAFFQGAIDWLSAEFGEENVVSVVQHNDETTPHLAAYVVPVDPDTGRLNAKRWTGGRQRCSAMQTRCHVAAGEPHGLQRGRKGSTAEHMSIRRWYAEHASLDERARDLRYDAIDIEARETEIGENLEELVKREQRLDRRELDQERRGYELDDREQGVGQREAQTAAERQALDERAEALAEREHAAQALSERLKGLQEAVERRESALAEREHRLAALEQQLEERGERLCGGEAALEQRQAEIDRAGEKLRQRLVEAREQEQAWEARRDAWLHENRPPAVPELVQQLRALADMGPLEAAEFMDRHDELHDWYSPFDGYTPEAQELLSRYEGAAEELERWERTVEPPAGGSKGPGL